MTPSFRHLPNMLSGFRLVTLVPLTLLSAYRVRDAFAVLLIVAYLSDILDGVIARRYNLTSDLGRRLDTVADNLFFPGIVAWLYLLGIKDLDKAVLPAALLVLYIVLIEATSVLRCGKPESLHLYSLKSASLPGMLVALYSLLTGRFPLPLGYVLAGWVFIGLSEKMLILLLTRGRCDFEVTSIFQLRKRRRSDTHSG